tara:strand:+ start:104 stop:1117 length:1014 start_codon:yes stop_codon:yes gene_type:complete
MSLFNYKKPLLIAEISGNHNQNKNRFLKLVDSAFKNGADLVKIQTYEPVDITLNTKNKKFKINKGLWKGKYLWDLYKKAHTPFAWHKAAFDIAKKYKKILFSSPFSKRGVDLLEKYNVKIYKLASFEITDLKLINYIASKKKPIIISTGMSSIKEIQNAIKTIKKFHNKIIILHCVSNYPTNLKDTNLGRIIELKKIFKNYKIGLSDHTNDIYSSIASCAYGVVAIEKHFNLDNKKTTDSDFSITPEKLKLLNQVIKDLSIKPKKNQLKNGNMFKLRRSIFASKNIKINETFKAGNIETYRPKIGLCASNYFKIIGKKSRKNIKKGFPIFKEFVSNQ